MATNLANAGVQIVASPTGAAYQAPRGNAFLDIAEGLSGVNQNLQPLLQTYAKKKQGEADARAKTDALKNSGEAFANAVRSGKIEPTQNPWYIQAYEKNAAQVRAQAAMSKLVEDSQSWEERSDPAAYATKFSQAQGELRSQFQGVDQLEGFESAANPLAQQSIQANVAYNVQRIKQENDQNISTLATTGILDMVKANNGKPVDAAQVYAALEPQRVQWMATGGTEAQWNNLQINSIIAAAANSGDEAVADKLLDSLSDDRGGKGALANIAGPSGNPVAEDIMQARYRISQAIGFAGMGEIRAKRNQAVAEGQQAEQVIWDTFGTDFSLGQVSKVEIIDTLKAANFSPQGIQEALNSLSEAAGKNASLGRALMGADPEVFDLFTEAKTKGYSPDFQKRLQDKALRGEIDLNEYEQILSTASGTTDRNQSEAKSDARAARSDANARAIAGVLPTRSIQQLTQNRQSTLGAVSQGLAKVGDKSLTTNPGKRTALEKTLMDVQGAYLDAHPGDVTGANLAVDNYANTYLSGELAKRAPKPGGAPKPAASTSANPRAR